MYRRYQPYLSGPFQQPQHYIGPPRQIVAGNYYDPATWGQGSYGDYDPYGTTYTQMHPDQHYIGNPNQIAWWLIR